MEVSVAEMEGIYPYDNENAISKDVNIETISANEKDNCMQSFDPNKYNQSPHISAKNGQKGFNDWYQIPNLNEKSPLRAYASLPKSRDASVESRKVDNASRFPLQISCARFVMKDNEK